MEIHAIINILYKYCSVVVLRHSFNKVVETFLRDLGLCWHNSIRVTTIL